MKKVFIIFSVLSFSVAYSQFNKKSMADIQVMIGKSYSNFWFHDSEKNKDKQLDFQNGSIYSANVLVNFSDRHKIRPEIFYYEAGALSSVEQIGLAWKLNYLGLGSSYQYNILNSNSFELSLGALFRFDYLIKGSQIIGDKRIENKQVNMFKNFDLNSSIYLNSSFSISQSVSFIAECRSGLGFLQIENQDAANGQKTRNFAHQLLIGLSFKL